MVMPMAGRVVFAVIGGLLVLFSAYSVAGTLIVTRSVSSRLTRWVDQVVDRAYQLAVSRASEYSRADRVLATQAAAILLTQLAAWLIVAYVGFALLLWPFASHGVVSAFIDAGSSLFTLGFAVPAGLAPTVIVFLAAATGLVILALQIAYLPALYAAFNRRETQVALLSGRAGVPSWGPELLARTHYALGTGVSTLDTMPDLRQPQAPGPAGPPGPSWPRGSGSGPGSCEHTGPSPPRCRRAVAPSPGHPMPLL